MKLTIAQNFKEKMNNNEILQQNLSSSKLSSSKLEQFKIADSA